MARNKKSIFNKIIKEPKIEETSKEIVFEDVHDINPIDELKEIEQKEVSLKDSGEKLAEVIKEKEIEEPVVEEKTEEPVVKEIIITKPTKEQLLRLSKSGLRWYQRTGKLPK